MKSAPQVNLSTSIFLDIGKNFECPFIPAVKSSKSSKSCEKLFSQASQQYESGHTVKATISCEYEKTSFEGYTGPVDLLPLPLKKTEAKHTNQVFLKRLKNRYVGQLRYGVTG